MQFSVVFCILAVTSAFSVTDCLSFKQPFVKAIPPVAVRRNSNKCIETSKGGATSERLNHEQFNDNIGRNELGFTALMLCGALSRTIATLAVHPLHVMKVNLQQERPNIHSTTLEGGSILKSTSLASLTAGLPSQLLFTLPHGALNFAVAETTKKLLLNVTSSLAVERRKYEAVLDLLAASISTLVCSIISIPQMILIDRIIVGHYPNVIHGVSDILNSNGLRGFYQGWLPGMLSKIPSNAIAWTIFQFLKKRIQPEQLPRYRFALASLASAASCSIMNPVDTVKTRLNLQRGQVHGDSSAGSVTYRGIADCFRQILKDEGGKAFYYSLPPRLLSFVPMMAIQYAVYDILKLYFVNRRQNTLAAIGRADNSINGVLTTPSWKRGMSNSHRNDNFAQCLGNDEQKNMIMKNEEQYSERNKSDIDPPLSPISPLAPCKNV